MNIIHFIESISMKSGGPARSVTNLLDALIKQFGDSFRLFAKQSADPVLLNECLKANIHVFGGNRTLTDKLGNNLGDDTVFHGHGIWQLSIHKMAVLARKNKIPYIISPRGMLEPWSLSQKRFKKCVALFIYQRKDLVHSSVIHATALMEAQNIRSLGFTNPIAIIPNGINLENFPKTPLNIKGQNKKILFLSRIHKKKGIENLLDAWVQLPKCLTSTCKMEIVGNGEKLYIKSLKKKIFDLGLNNCVEIKNPVFGEDKIKLFREASIFILPSFSENFGMVVAESLAAFTPVITTKATPWQDLETHNCGWWIDVGVEPLYRVLQEALNMDEDILRQMGVRGHNLILQKYCVDKVARDMHSLYSWTLNKKVKPDFIM